MPHLYIVVITVVVLFVIGWLFLHKAKKAQSPSLSTDDEALLQETDAQVVGTLQEDKEISRVVQEVRELLELEDESRQYESLYTIFIRSEGEETLRALKKARYTYGCSEFDQASKVLWDLLADKFRELIAFALENRDRVVYEEARELRYEISMPASNSWSFMSFDGVIDRSVSDQGFDFAEKWNDMVLYFEEAPNYNDFVSMIGLTESELGDIIRLAEKGDRSAVYKAELLSYQCEFKDAVLDSWFRGVMDNHSHLLAESDLAKQVAYKVSR